MKTLRVEYKHTTLETIYITDKNSRVWFCVCKTIKKTCFVLPSFGRAKIFIKYTNTSTLPIPSSSHNNVFKFVFRNKYH